MRKYGISISNDNGIKVTRGIGSLSVKGQNWGKIQDFRIINIVEIFHEYCWKAENMERVSWFNQKTFNGHRLAKFNLLRPSICILLI